MLGSGYVCGPLVEYLTRESRIAITIATNVLDQGYKLSRTYPNTSAISLDVKDPVGLERLVSNHDLVVSFVPYQLHPLVAQQCITHKVNMLTSSYVSAQLQALHDKASEAGITMVNEVGLDPGIDHMLAVQCFDEVLRKGGKVTSFQSWCGGLPAPECANNPLKYKFSWSPLNVLMATKNPAKYLEEGHVIEIPAGSLMESAKPMNLYTELGLAMEGYPNRDSTQYGTVYGLADVQTLLRGTLRYKGFCHAMVGLTELGLLDEKPLSCLEPGAPPLKWRELVAMLVSPPPETTDLRSAVYEVLGKDEEKMKAVDGLRILSDDPVDPQGTPISAFCSHLQKQLVFAPDERDAVFLRHIIGIEWPDQKRETRHIDLTHYGVPHGFSAMAQCVGKPAGIAAKMILTGEIKKKGVVRPVTKDVYQPILDRLKLEGIEATVSKHRM